MKSCTSQRRLDGCALRRRSTQNRRNGNVSAWIVNFFTVELNPSVAVDVSPDTSEPAPADSTAPVWIILFEDLSCIQIFDAMQREYPHTKFVILEALSATGLRSIRYAKEIPHVRFAHTLTPPFLLSSLSEAIYWRTIYPLLLPRLCDATSNSTGWIPVLRLQRPKKKPQALPRGRLKSRSMKAMHGGSLACSTIRVITFDFQHFNVQPPGT